MRRGHYNRVSQYMFIFCLGIALLFAQTFKLHMHIEHEDTSLTNTEVHTVDLHAVSYLHEINHNSNHHDDIQQHHNSDIDVGSTTNNLVKKSQTINPFVFFIFIIFILLCVPLLSRIHTWFEEKKPRAFSYCFPPQRAPPIF